MPLCSKKGRAFDQPVLFFRRIYYSTATASISTFAPLGSATTWKAALAGNGWSPRMGLNSVQGRYHAPEAGVLQISLPWSEGWRAFVNGEERPLTRCGGMYMGLALESGDWEIELRYETPWLRYGIAVTIIGLLAIAVALVAGRQLRRQR